MHRVKCISLSTKLPYASYYKYVRTLIYSCELEGRTPRLTFTLARRRVNLPLPLSLRPRPRLPSIHVHVQARQNANTGHAQRNEPTTTTGHHIAALDIDDDHSDALADPHPHRTKKATHLLTKHPLFDTQYHIPGYENRE